MSLTFLEKLTLSAKMKSKPAWRLTVRITSQRDLAGMFPLPEIGEIQITIYIEAVMYLITFGATDTNIANET